MSRSFKVLLIVVALFISLSDVYSLKSSKNLPQQRGRGSRGNDKDRKESAFGWNWPKLSSPSTPPSMKKEVKPSSSHPSRTSFSPKSTTISSSASTPTPPNTSTSLVSAIALVAGTTVGAGILALPAVAVKPGFSLSTLALIGCWLYMVTSGLLIAEINCNLVRINPSNRDSGILSMSQKILGPLGASFSGAVYVFIHYALLVAYIAQAGGILYDGSTFLVNRFSLPPWSGPVFFATTLGSLLAFGNTSMIENTNNFFVVLVLASFLALVGLGVPSMNLGNLTSSDISSLWSTIPVMFVALVYHNIVPAISSQLNYDKKKITTVISVGSLIPLCMFIVWNAVILGIGSGGMEDVGQFDPVAILRNSGGNSAVSFLVSIFSESAIITSFFGFVVGLISFFNDAFRENRRLDESSKKLVFYILTLVPPTIIAVLNPNIFLSALDSAGTFGISILFGLLPAVMALKLRNDESKLQLKGGNGGKAQMKELGNGGGKSISRLAKPGKLGVVGGGGSNYEYFVDGGVLPIVAVLIVTTGVIGQKLFT